MIPKNPAELILQRRACSVVAESLEYAKSLIRPGLTTKELDTKMEEFIISKDATPSCKNYQGYPATICASVNEVVVHGIPSDTVVLKEGDIISVDVVVDYKGFHGDATRTFAVGEISQEKKKLIKTCEECFYEGIKNLKAGVRVGEISHAIQVHAEENGFSVVRELVGHGIGSHMHEDPSIPNFGKTTDGPIIKENVCLAIEPMINAGKKDVWILSDGWTVITRDKKPSAHYENTVLVTKDGAEILTLSKEEKI